MSKETATFVKLEKDDEEETLSKETVDSEEVMEKIRSKLKSSRTNVQTSSGTLREKEKPKAQEIVPVSDSDSDEFGNELERERQVKRKKKA